MQTLNDYLNEWSDYPVLKINLNNGEQHALWLAENLNDEFIEILTDESIIEAQTELLHCTLLGNKLDIENAEIDLKKLVADIFKHHLIELISDHKNSFDIDEENRLERQSFDRQR